MRNRRNLLVLLAALTSSAVVESQFVTSAYGQAAKPNIVVIISDDMGYTDTSPYGSEILTPNLQRMADNGLRFSDFYATPRCSPSRAALITGQYSHAVGVGHLSDGPTANGGPGYVNDLNRTSNQTMAEMLRGAGYATQAIGKWHVTPKYGVNTSEADKYNWPLQRGFDQFYGTIRGGASFYDPVALVRDNAFVSPFSAAERANYDKAYYTVADYVNSQQLVNANPSARPSDSFYHFTDAITDHSVGFINDHFGNATTKDKPLFQYVAYTAAHWPLHALPEDAKVYESVYNAGYESVRQARFTKAKQAGLVPANSELPPMTLDNWSAMSAAMKNYEIEAMKQYAGQVSQMDRGIGKIMDALQANGQLDNTLILYMQDNGANHEGGLSPNTVTNPPANRAANPTLPTQSMDMLQPALQPSQTRDGYVVRGNNGANPVNNVGAPDTYEYLSQQWGNVSNAMFQTYKSDTGEGGIASPLIAYWGNGIAANLRGGVVHDPSHLIDIMATLQDVTDASYPAAGGAVRPLDGVSLASTFTGGSVQRDVPLFWEHEGWRAARKGDWKLMASGPSGIWELYDMSSDRAELHNVATAHPQVVSNLASQWEGWAAANQVTPWPWSPQYQNLLPNQKPVIHLKLDEPSVLNGSQLADTQGATYTFAANDAADHAVNAGVPAGLGGAVRFNNSNNNSDVIRINSTLVPYGRQARSLAAWVNVASVNATDDNRLFAYQSSDATNGSWFAITLDDTDNDNQDIEAIRFRYTGSHTYAPVGGPIAMNAWFHIAVVMPEAATAGLVEVYINGVKAGLVSTTTSGVLLDTLAGDLGIGGRPDSQFNLGFEGMIADFQLYNRALSGDQVLELFNNPGNAVPEPTAAVVGGAAGTMLLRRSRK